ncbi:MAG TPA: hypothetical protein VH760_00395 [Gaiellaceae bacterium]
MFQTTSTAVNANTLTATCPAANPNVIGGGYSGIAGGGNAQYATDSFPPASNQWRVNLAANDNSWTVYAICSK